MPKEAKTAVTRLGWYIHRLRAMPPAEVLHRLKHLTLRQHLRITGPPAQFRQIVAPAPGYVSLSFDDCVIEPLSAFTQTWLALADKAKSPERHVFSFLGAPDRDFGLSVDWHCDPLTGQRWPSDVPGWRINYRHAHDIGEVKYVWELGRMPWLIPWSLAARVLGDTHLAGLVLEDIFSFVRANPPYFGIHWTSGIELGVRIVAWTWALALVAPLVTLTKEEWAEIGGYIAVAADYCRRFLSLYSSANNHLIAEGAALEIAGTAWPWIPQAQEFAELGRRILDSEIPRQILTDGSSIEMCPAYLKEVLLWSLAVVRVRNENAVEVPALWRERWSASADFLEWLCGSEAATPPLGDDDEGQVLPTGIHEPPTVLVQLLRGWSGVLPAHLGGSSPLATLLSPRKRLSQESDLTTHARDSERNEMLSLPLAPRREQARETGGGSPHPLQGARFFSESGVAVIRSGKLRLLADFGPHGMPPLYAHAHADALSLIMDYDGQPILLDPGTYCYHGQRAWRDYFRSTRAHNTVCVNNRDQSEMKGPFLWGRVAHTRVTHIDCGPPALFAAEHNGYAPLIHHRTIKHVGRYEFVVLDRLSSESQKSGIFPKHQLWPVFQWWHFAPAQLEIGHEGLAWESLFCRLVMTFEVSAPFVIVRQEGELNPIQGWFSPRFSERIPAPAVGVQVNTWTPPLVFRTRIKVTPKSA